jgi:hypothetical protein
VGRCQHSAAEVVGEHENAAPRIATCVVRLGPLGIGRHDDAPGGVDSGADRGRLRRAVRAAGNDDHVVARPDEVEQSVEADPGIRGDRSAHAVILSDRRFAGQWYYGGTMATWQ